MNEYFREIDGCPAFARVAAKIVTHPKKDGYAKVLAAYPKDGAGRLTVYVVDGFGPRFTTQRGRAGGYGYDKFTAALSGLTIDGHVMSDHSGADLMAAKLLKQYGKIALAGQDTTAIEAKIRAKGYSLTNWTSNGGYKPNEWNGYQSCYKTPGLDYLRAIGYRVIDVI